MTKETSFKKIAHPSPKTAGERAVLMANPGFGKVFSDHMVTIAWSADKGWHDALIRPARALDHDGRAVRAIKRRKLFDDLVDRVDREMNDVQNRRRRKALSGALCAVVAAAALGMASGAQAATSSPTNNTGSLNSLLVNYGPGGMYMPNAWRTN